MEILDIIDEKGNVISQAHRSECHDGSLLLHAVVHALVFNTDGGLFLQKRSSSKDIQPGKWDTSVGGHINSGETVKEAIEREALEELGISGGEFEKIYSYIMTSDVEREFVHTFKCIWDKKIEFNTGEIDEIRIFHPQEIDSFIGKGFFTPNFEQEWELYNNRQEKYI